MYHDVTLVVPSTCPALIFSGATYMTSSMANINLIYSAVIDSVYKIFDPGASLAIYFDKNDFVGPIKILVNPRLGGLANGLSIEGIGTVKWKFRTNIAAIVVTSSCYHVPNTRARLISPQRLFCQKLGVTNCFLAEEYCATLEFDKLCWYS